MSKIITILLVIVMSHSARGETFFISELFGNMAGRQANKGKAWIELTNKLSEPILVVSLGIQIINEPQASTIFEKTVSFPEPISFTDHLLITASEHLGLEICLKDTIPQVLIPDLSLQDISGKKICVLLNDEHRSCVSISKKTKFLDGISLFREQDRSVWFNEPCHLIDGIFATPGARSRSCAQHAEWRDQIFSPCDDRAREHRTVRLHEQINHAPVITLFQVQTFSSSLSVRVAFTDEDNDEMAMLTTCASPKSTAKLCQKIAPDKLINPGQPHEIISHIVVPASNEVISWKVRDLAGAKVSIAGDNVHQPSSAGPASSSAPLAFTEDGQIHVSFLPHEVPVNVVLYGVDGQPQHQYAFVTPGEKVLDMTRQQQANLHKIQCNGASGRKEIVLPEEQKSRLASSCYSGSHASIWMLLLAWLLFGSIRMHR